MHWFRSKEKMALDDALRRLMKPATKLIVERAAPHELPFPPTSSHFGGDPYFEHGESWPTYHADGRPYDFVCQINLNECPIRPDVPFNLFAVYLCWKLHACETEDSFEKFCVVRTYRDPSPEKAVTIPRPNPLEHDDYHVRACHVRQEVIETFPHNWTEFPEVNEALSKFVFKKKAFDEALKRLGGMHDFPTQIGGYPRWVHCETFERDNILVAQINSERDANNCIGDCAPIFIGVSPSDPTKVLTDAFQSF